MVRFLAQERWLTGPLGSWLQGLQCFGIVTTTGMFELLDSFSLGPDFQTGNILFQSLSKGKFTNFFCVPSQAYVESQVKCMVMSYNTSVKVSILRLTDE